MRKPGNQENIFSQFFILATASRTRFLIHSWSPGFQIEFLSMDKHEFPAFLLSQFILIELPLLVPSDA